MTATEDPVDQLARAIDETEAVIARLRPADASLPTPCANWDVRTLVNHVVSGLQVLGAAAGGAPAGGHGGDAIGDDWIGAYRAAAAATLAEWRQEGAMERIVHLPVGDVPATWAIPLRIAELLVHGWDLAHATGQPVELDPQLTETTLAWSQANLRPEFRGAAGSAAFGPEIPLPAGASVYDRLAAFFGRDPG